MASQTVVKVIFGLVYKENKTLTLLLPLLRALAFIKPFSSNVLETSYEFLFV